MSNNATQINEEDYEDDEDFTDEDYGFILGPDGELKSLMIPEDLMENPPKNVLKILKILGIKDIHDIEPKTLH
jgi:hypothetical protein